jgi:hypothetical protein
VNLSANADWTRTRIVRGHGLDADGHGPDTATDMDWLRTRMRAWPGHGGGHGRGADMDCFRTGRGRGLDTATDGWPGYGADIPRQNRDFIRGRNLNWCLSSAQRPLKLLGPTSMRPATKPDRSRANRAQWPATARLSCRPGKRPAPQPQTPPKIPGSSRHPNITQSGRWPQTSPKLFLGVVAP